MEVKSTIVVTSYYNNKSDLEKTLRSISGDCDVLIIDDGSEVSIADFFYQLVPNECVNYNYIINEVNLGIPSSLNKALVWAEKLGYKYYCRLDSGDEFIKGKLEKQYDFLQKNTDYVMVGSYAYIKNNDSVKLWKKPVFHDDIIKEMHLNSPYIHSTCMINLSAIIKAGMYNIDYKVAQDYEMITRLKGFGKLYNLPVSTIYYDYNDDSISSKKRKVQIKNRLKVQASIFDFSFLSYYGIVRTLLLSFFSRDAINYLKSFFRIGK